MTKIQYIYRMTHIENIPHILQYGITSHLSPNKNPDYKNIGDKTLITARDTMVFDVEGRQINLKDFIPFYFGIKMPMLYVIPNGFNNVVKVAPEEIIYMACSLQEILSLGVDYIFSDGHAKDAFTQFFGKLDIQRIDNIIEINTIKNDHWGGEENLEVKRKKQAEFLVKEDIPTRCIKMFGCYNEDAKTKLINMGIAETMIQVAHKAYF